QNWNEPQIASKLDLVSHGSPERSCTEGDVLQAAFFHHISDLGLGESLFEACPKSVESIRPHHVKTLLTVLRKRQRFDVGARLFEKQRQPRQRKINSCRDHLAHYIS